MKSAVQQSQRNLIPKIKYYQKIKEINLNDYDLVIVAHEQEHQQSLLNLKNQINCANKILVFVGPEGGISMQETMFLKKFAHVNIISLGKSILRSETAQITLLANIKMLREGI